MRDPLKSPKVGLLATGDEISYGDIINTNTQTIAKTLFELGIQVGFHITSADHINEIETAITFLLTTHDCIIITGGLGPTSDDLTRFAVAKSLQRQLIFHEPTWEKIVARLQNLGYNLPPASNRQQALFPEEATIIENKNGTAAGCLVHNNKKIIFMLPGPPNECLPMVQEVVIPTLLKAHYPHKHYHKNWLLLGVSEGQIAELLDTIVNPYHCHTGYRLFYPYIEFKIYSTNQDDFKMVLPLIEKAIRPYIIDNGSKTASEVLRLKLNDIAFAISIQDFATGGLLEGSIKTPANHKKLSFTDTKNKNNNWQIIITGLKEYWQNKIASHTHIVIEFIFSDKKEILNLMVPLRGERTKQYATELIAWNMLKKLF